MKPIAEIIAGRIEPTEPQTTIIATLKKSFEGKQWTKRTVDALIQATGDDTIRLRKAYGMLHLDWGNWGRNTISDNNGGTLLLAHSETSVCVDTADIVSRNPSFFSASTERNTGRTKALKNAKHLEAVEAACHAAREAWETMIALSGTCYDDIAIRKAYGVWETDRCGTLTPPQPE
jgi:hypothetical protein